MTPRRAFLASEIAALESVASLLGQDAVRARTHRRELQSHGGGDDKLDERIERLTAEAETLRRIARRGEP